MYNAIVTMPPYAPHLAVVLRHPFVSGIRLNTVMPLERETPVAVVDRLAGEAQRFGKTLYVDLKTRQLRVKGLAVPPFTQVELTHKITVRTPTTAYFGHGDERTLVLAVEGNRLILATGPQRGVGPGEAVNIPDPSLRVDGFFTESDLAYIDASAKVGAHDYMLSFTEDAADISALLARDDAARPVAKIESERGLAYVQSGWRGEARLMAARGDLFVQIPPHRINDELEAIVRKDSTAIVGSRLLESLAQSDTPSCEDIGDVGNLLRTGFSTFMFGDQIAFHYERILSGLNLVELLAMTYERNKTSAVRAEKY